MKQMMTYSSPQVEIMEIETDQIICGSVDSYNGYFGEEGGENGEKW